MKRLLVGVLVAMMLCTVFSGCGSGSGGDSAKTDNSSSAGASVGTAPSGQTEKLTFILRSGAYTNVMKNLAPAFGIEHNVEFEFLDLDVANMYEKIALNSKSKAGSYDVLMIDEPWFREFRETGVISNLSEMGYKLDSDFIEQTTKVGLDENGNVYGVPFFGNVIVLFYNKDILKSYGYNEPPKVWSEVLKLAQQVKKDGKEGYLVRAQAGENIVTDIYPILLSHGANILDENNNVTINTPEFKKAVEFYIQLKNAGTIMEKDDIVAAVTHGKAALSLTWPGWYTPTVDEPTTFATMPMKVEETDTERASSIYGIWYLGIASNSQHKDMALEFIKYITGQKEQIASVEFGGVPTRNSAYQDKTVLEQKPHLAVIYKVLQNGVFRPQIKEWTEITSTVGTELDNAVQNTKSVDQALKDAQEAVEKILVK